MNTNKRSTVFGAALLILTLLLGMLVGFRLAKLLVEGKQSEAVLSFLRLPQGGLSKPTQGQPLPSSPKPEKCSFTAEDMQYVQLRYAADCNRRPNLQELLLQPLDWNLSGEAPTVLILHTHASESYTQTLGQSYEETAEFRTLDNHYNMVAVGDLLQQLLQEAGISVLHDRRIHDYPSYSSSYNNARTAVQSYLQQYPSIQVVLDLHRDAMLNRDGSQYATSAVVEGEKAAQLMLVVGTDAAKLYHPTWQDNLSAALKLQVLLEQQVQGITRPIMLRAQRFNHDLSKGAMIVEVGAAGNTQAEALRTVPVLAAALVELMQGANL